MWRPRLANDKSKAREKGHDSEFAEKVRALPGVPKWLKNSLAFRTTRCKKTEGFRASLKTSALAPVCLPWSREAGWMSDVSEFSMSSPLIQSKPGPAAGTDRAALHIWASRFSHRLFQPSPNGWIVVASVYSLASQRRVA